MLCSMREWFVYAERLKWWDVLPVNLTSSQAFCSLYTDIYLRPRRLYYFATAVSKPIHYFVRNFGKATILSENRWWSYKSLKRAEIHCESASLRHKVWIRFLLNFVKNVGRNGPRKQLKLRITRNFIKLTKKTKNVIKRILKRKKFSICAPVRFSHARACPCIHKGKTMMQKIARVPSEKGTASVYATQQISCTLLEVKTWAGRVACVAIN